MSERRILVIGSQCEAPQHLNFLPHAAQDLYAVMTDRERGACVSAIDGEGDKPPSAEVEQAYLQVLAFPRWRGLHRTSNSPATFPKSAPANRLEPLS